MGPKNIERELTAVPFTASMEAVDTRRFLLDDR
jgi:hypothetical protein